VADSGAVRQQRSKAHKAGDHRYCRSTCPESGKFGAFSVATEPETNPGQPADQVADPTAEMRELAARLAAAHRTEPGNALLARELRMTLQALMPQGGVKPDDDLAGLFAELGAS